MHEMRRWWYGRVKSKLENRKKFLTKFHAEHLNFKFFEISINSMMCRNSITNFCIFRWLQQFQKSNMQTKNNLQFQIINSVLVVSTSDSFVGSFMDLWIFYWNSQRFSNKTVQRLARLEITKTLATLNSKLNQHKVDKSSWKITSLS